MLCKNLLTKWAGNTDRSKDFSIIVEWNFLIKGKFYQSQEKVINTKVPGLVYY